MDVSSTEGADAEHSLQEQCVGQLLRVARAKISEGEGGAEDALAALLHAVRITQGEDAIMDVLEGAKRRADEEAAASEHADAHTVALRMSRLLEADKTTLLYEQGLSQVLRSAFEDGSSVVCSACNALVPRARFTQHQLYWCEHATGGEDDLNSESDDDDDGGGG